MQQRLLQLSGIVFVALIAVTVLGVGGTDTPDTAASAERVASFYGDHALRQGVASFLLAASAPFIVLFGIGVELASRTGDRLSAWRYVLLVGTALAAGGVLLTAFTHFALANGADENISPTALQALNALDGNTWMAFNPAFGVMMLGAAGVLLPAGRSRWLGWIALVLGVAAFLPFADFFALLAMLLWIVVAAIVLARGDRDAAHVAAPGAA